MEFKANPKLDAALAALEGDMIKTLQRWVRVPSVRADRSADNAPFGAEVRRALSLALDRDHIVSITGGTNKAATGIVPAPVYNTKAGTSFREKQGNILATTANLDEAKSLAKSASGDKTIRLVCRDYTLNGTDELVAKYAKEQWERAQKDILKAE